MFVCLLIGKVWGWIGEGRVEILEQQPPPNPRLFHARLSVSLIISTMFDIFLLRYSVNTVLRHARPNMMVMFAFEFAVLTITSISTAARYTISLHEASVIGRQIKDRRAQMRRQREADRQQPATTDQPALPEAPTRTTNVEDDFDSSDVDVPGWEEKGRWVFYLDLATGMFWGTSLGFLLWLTFALQTFSNWFFTLPSSVSFACFMACPSTSFVMWLSPFAHSTNASLISFATDKQHGI